jgi:hypothetical protein
MALKEVLLARLADDAPGGARARLAALVADELLARPVGELVAPRAVAEAGVALCAAGAASDEAVARLAKPAVDLADDLHDDSERLSALVPADIVHTVRDLAAHPYTPDRKVAEKLMSSDVVRQALREAIAAALEATTQKSPVGGLMGLGKKMAEQAMARSGALGAMIESKSSELVDAALAALLERVVDIVCDPARAKEQAALRRALVDSALGLRGRDLARELRRSQPLKIAAIVRKHVGAWAARPEAVDELEDLVRRLVADDLPRPAGEVLAELGLAAPARAALQASIERAMAPVVRAPAFAAWLDELLHGAQGG